MASYFSRAALGQSPDAAFDKICDRLISSKLTLPLSFEYLPGKHLLRPRAIQRFILTIPKISSRIVSLAWTCADSEAFSGADSLLAPEVGLGFLNGTEIFQSLKCCMPRLERLHLKAIVELSQKAYDAFVSAVTAELFPRLRSMELEFDSARRMQGTLFYCPIPGMLRRLSGKLESIKFRHQEANETWKHPHAFIPIGLDPELRLIPKTRIEDWPQALETCIRKSGLPLCSFRLNDMSFFRFSLLSLPYPMANVQQIYEPIFPAPPPDPDVASGAEMRLASEAARDIAFFLRSWKELALSKQEAADWAISKLDELIPYARFSMPSEQGEENPIIDALFAASSYGERELHAAVGRLKLCLERDCLNWIAVLNLLNTDTYRLQASEYADAFCALISKSWLGTVCRFLPSSIMDAVQTLLKKGNRSLA